MTGRTQPIPQGHMLCPNSGNIRVRRDARRLTGADGTAVMLLVPAAGIAWASAACSDDDAVIAVIIGVVAASAFAWAFVFAVWPRKVIGWSIRSQSSYPTRMPGYRTPLSGESDDPEQRGGRE